MALSIETDVVYNLVFSYLGDSSLEKIIAASIALTVRGLIGIIIFYVGSRIIKRVLIVLDKIYEKTNIDSDVYFFLRSLFRVFLYIILFIPIFMNFGVSQGSIVALLGATGVAVAFALKDTLSNFAGGIILLLFRPYSKGNFIEVRGKMGEVQEINVFSTELNTVDNKRVIIPNGILANNEITNFSRNNVRRVEIIFRVDYASDYEKAIQLLEKIAANQEKVIQTITRTIRLRELGETSVNIIYRVWCKTENYWDVYYDTIDLAKKAFEKNDIRIPYPQMDIHIREEGKKDEEER